MIDVDIYAREMDHITLGKCGGEKRLESLRYYKDHLVVVNRHAHLVGNTGGLGDRRSDSEFRHFTMSPGD